MQDDPHDYTRQDEEISSVAFTEEEKADEHDFGSWPDLFGLVAAIAITWMIFTFAQ